MIKPLCTLGVASLMLGPVTSASTARAQAPADSVKLAADTPVRARASVLGPGWQDGTIANLSISNGAECLGFAPTVPGKIGGMTLDAVDSLEVRVPSARAASPAGRLDEAGTTSLWIGVPRERLLSLSRGCQRPPR